MIKPPYFYPVENEPTYAIELLKHLSELFSYQRARRLGMLNSAVFMAKIYHSEPELEVRASVLLKEVDYWQEL